MIHINLKPNHDTWFWFFAQFQQNGLPPTFDVIKLLPHPNFLDIMSFYWFICHYHNFSSQHGNGALLNTTASHGFEVDASSMNPCMLAPPQCTTGATYIFWMKLLDTFGGGVLTTMDWSSAREGIRISTADNGKLGVVVFKEGSDSKRFSLSSQQVLHDKINMWQQVAVVWFVTPRVKIYLDGLDETASQPSTYSSSSNTLEARMRMVVGRPYVVHKATFHTPPNMLFDELSVFGWPLASGELADYFPQ